MATTSMKGESMVEGITGWLAAHPVWEAAFSAAAVVAVAGAVLLRRAASGRGARAAASAALVLVSLAAVAWAGAEVVARGPMSPMFSTTRLLAARLGTAFPEVAFRRVDENAPLSVSHYRGKVVVLDLWWTQCGACRRLLPELNRLQERLGDRGVVVITLSDEPREQLPEVLRAEAPATVHGYAESFGWLDTVSDFRPLTVVIDREGVLRGYHFGAEDEAALAARVQPLL